MTETSSSNLFLLLSVLTAKEFFAVKPKEYGSLGLHSQALFHSHPLPCSLSIDNFLVREMTGKFSQRATYPVSPGAIQGARSQRTSRDKAPTWSEGGEPLPSPHHSVKRLALHCDQRRKINLFLKAIKIISYTWLIYRLLRISPFKVSKMFVSLLDL